MLTHFPPLSPRTPSSTATASSGVMKRAGSGGASPMDLLGSTYAAGLKTALSALAGGRDSLDDLARQYGFTAPAADQVSAQVLVGWVNLAVGEVFVAPSSGWRAPSESWKPLIKVDPAWLAPFLEDKGLALAHDAPHGGPGEPPSDPAVPPSGATPPPPDAGKPLPSASEPAHEHANDETGKAAHLIGKMLDAGTSVRLEGGLAAPSDAAHDPLRVGVEWRVGDKVIGGATGLQVPWMPLLAGKPLAVTLSVTTADGATESVTRSVSVPESLSAVAGKLLHWAPLADGAQPPPRDASAPAATSPAPTGRELLAQLPDWSVEEIDYQRFSVRASAEPTATDSTAVRAADVLAALKLAQGRNPNADPDGPGPLTAASTEPYQLIAADIDANGVVDPDDAHTIARDVIEHTVSGTRKHWVFVPENSDLSGVSRKAVAWHAPADAADPAATPTNWIGVMLGDIDGSWKSDLSAPAY